MYFNRLLHGLVTVMLLFVCTSFADVVEIELDADTKQVVKQRSQEIVEFSKTKEIITAVRNQNKQKLSIEEVQQRDQVWLAADDDETRKAMLDSKALETIKKFASAKRAIFNEFILTDKVGATIASYPLSSDYWQGDEDKFVEPAKSRRMFFGVIEHDESSDTHAIQISVPIIDKGEVAGVLIVGVRFSYVQARSRGY